MSTLYFYHISPSYLLEDVAEAVCEAVVGHNVDPLVGCTNGSNYVEFSDYGNPPLGQKFYDKVLDEAGSKFSRKVDPPEDPCGSDTKEAL